MGWATSEVRIDSRAFETVYAERMSTCLAKLYPEASDLLKIAARAQHLRRWDIARDTYPEGRKGYNEWRRACRAHHATLVGVIGLCYFAELFYSNPDLGAAVKHAVVPEFSGKESVLLAVGILGATVMPHVIYLHSALTKPRAAGRPDEEKRRLIRFERIDVVLAMAIAGVVNMSMLVVAAAVFHQQGFTQIADLDEALRVARDLAAANPGGAYELRPVLLYNPDPRPTRGGPR